MEWNAKSLGQWDWEHMLFNAKATENPRLQPTHWSAEADGEIDVGLIYPSGGSGCSGSELLHASSSRSLKSASINSSSNGDSKTSTSMFAFEGSQDDSTGKKELLKQLVENSLAPEPSSASGEPLLTLKLGKQSYFEDVAAGTDSKKPSSNGVPVSSSSSAAEKCKSSSRNLQRPSCQVEGCGLDLSSAKDYHRKHKVCDSHSKSPKVVVAGLERRFCQQCSRFHGLLEFDDKKRSCRRRLSDHNARRRKPQHEAVQLNTSALSSSPYDGRQLVRPFGYSRNATNSGLQDIIQSRWLLPQTKDFLISDGSSTGDLLTSKATTFPGKEGPATSSDPNAAAQDVNRALSLLSTTNSWVTHAMTPRLPLASSEYWHADPQPASSNACISYSDCDNSSNRFQDFQMFSAPYGSGFHCNQLD